MTDASADRKSLRANLMLAAAAGFITFLALFAAAEVFVRLTRPRSTVETQRASALEYEHTLFARHAFPQMAQDKKARWGNTYHINDRGYRGEEFDVPKPDDVTRLVVLGGSAGFDIRAESGADWPSLVEDRLLEGGEGRFEVINASSPGHASWDSLGRLFAEIWMFEPDWVLVYHCWNDLKYFESLSPEQSLLRTYRPKRTVDSESNLVDNPFVYYRGPLDRLLSYSQLYTRLRERYFKWRAGRLSLEGRRPEPDGEPDSGHSVEWARRQFELSLTLLASGARAIGAEPVFITQARLVTADNTPEERDSIDYGLVRMSHERLVRAFAECDESTRRVATEHSVLVIDAASELSGRREAFADHVHTTRAGSGWLAETVAQRIQAYLDSGTVGTNP